VNATTSTSSGRRPIAAEDVDHRAAVDTAEREFGCHRAHAGVDQQCLAVALDQQSARAHQHLAARGEQLGPR
jgi:hypothetical protein